MTKLEELIKELCPNGVEYKTLGEVSKVTSGSSAPQNPSAFSEKGIPFCRTSDVGRVHLSVDFDNIADKITDSAAKKMTLMPKGTILIPKSGASTLLNHKVRLNVESYIVSHLAAVIPNKDEINDRYLYYALTRFDMGELVEDKSYPSVKTSDIAEKVTIPVPPLPVQQEIVRILDNFTELTAELTTELTARKKQYEYYRDKLLSFDGTMNGGGYNKIALTELFDFRNGLSKGKEFFGRGIPFISYSDVYNHKFLHKTDIKALVECTTEEKLKLHVGRGDVLFTRTSETAEDIGHSSVMLDDIGDCVFNGFTIRATPKTDKLLPEYCAYCFDTYSFRRYVSTNCAFTTRASLTGSTIAEYKMTVPPLDVQERIVNVLDNFDAICSDLGIGLPAEIEKRRQQYEYYRDLLLTFTERGNTILNRTEQNRTEQNRTEQNRTEQNR